MSHNAKFDINLISKHWYINPMQASNFSIILGTIAMEFDTNEEINQVIYIHGPDANRASIYASIKQKQEYAHGFGVAKSRLKFALENGLVNKFVGLIARFIENHSGVAINERITVDITQIENPKKLKHKGCPKLVNSTQQKLNSRRDKLRPITESEDEYIEEGSSRKRVNEMNSENSMPKVEGVITALMYLSSAIYAKCRLICNWIRI
ncbi:8956_t:CDS:2 [Racocetra fulgida]|uniref:8956_t:CDS:1 n=1 Tax=Racocetra fulgida TaxID=60492 RepID=A0A9N8W792_9GLOM|nr:8956_t:CDS:2 [Racocetra fulgida]